MTHIFAEYADGYVHSEQDHGDVSPYNPTKNIFNDILEKRPEAEHGRLVRFSLVHGDKLYSVDWVGLPDNARPIRFKQMSLTAHADGSSETEITGVDFGYQYTDEDGQNVQEVVTL